MGTVDNFVDCRGRWTTGDEEKWWLVVGQSSSPVIGTMKKSGWEVCFCLDFPTTCCVVSRDEYASTRGSTWVALHNPGSLEAIGIIYAEREHVTIAFKAPCTLTATIGQYVNSQFQHFCVFLMIS